MYSDESIFYNGYAIKNHKNRRWELKELKKCKIIDLLTFSDYEKMFKQKNYKYAYKGRVH